MLPGSSISGFRDVWADRFIDPVLIRRVLDQGTFNEATLEYDGALGEVVYDGHGLIRPMTVSESRTTFGDEAISKSGYVCFIPYSILDVKVGDLLVPDTARFSGLLKGTEFYVEAVEVDSYQTRGKLYLSLNEGGSERGTSG